jgi:hypothetical protein
VNEALENIGFYPLKSSKTLAALDNLSPDSPTQQLITNLAIFISLIGFSLVLLSVVAIWDIILIYLFFDLFLVLNIKKKYI